MCGITGFVDFRKRSGAPELSRMSACIVHRGPDDQGSEIFDLENCTIAFGFRRLSILDLSPAGHQPMKGKNTWVLLNGEIYNFKEIRSELVSLGYNFVSNGDTEVIINAYDQWGEQCVDRFIGMFAIVIFDIAKNKLIFIRDRAGVKPFFYYMEDDLLIFGSELKSFSAHSHFRKEISMDGLSLYFQHGYISAPHTIFRNTHKLQPGHIAVYDLSSGSMTTRAYWNVIELYNRPVLNISYEDALVETERLLKSAFEYRMIADVPVGVFLSGGYDSTCVAAILQSGHASKIKTFTIGFGEVAFNEAPYAKAVADHLGTEHHEYFCTYSEAFDLIPTLPEIYDEPFGDSSGIPTTLVSRIARKHVTVALSADGGDELFAGYPRHRKGLDYIRLCNMVPGFLRKLMAPLIPQASSLADSNIRSKLKDFIRTSDVVEQFNIINRKYTPYEINRLVPGLNSLPVTAFEDGRFFNEDVDDLRRILAIEYKTYLVDDILQKVDRATMSVSLEGREPFLDQRLVDFISVLPTEFKRKGPRQKIILKDIVHKYVPPKLMDRPKMGFGVPVKHWCRNELKDLFMMHMSDNALASTGIFDVKKTRQMRDTYLERGIPDFEKIWLVFAFQMWFKKWM